MLCGNKRLKKKDLKKRFKKKKFAVCVWIWMKLGVVVPHIKTVCRMQ